MSLFLDNFVAPSLDNDRWSESLEGGSSYIIGSPVDGAYPVLSFGVTSENATIDSDSKTFVPANQDFIQSIFYNDVYTEASPLLDRFIFLKWNSMLKGAGSPLWGVSVELQVSAGPTYSFVKKITENGVLSQSVITIDPTSGANGGFRIIRSGIDYQLFYYDGSWVLLDIVSLNYKSYGFMSFGVYTDSGVLIDEGFPWLVQP